jgi:ABC-type multidrug transport system ATPase subunit
VIEVFGQRLTISRDPADTKRASLEIRAGTLTYLKAPSGTGKTTLVKLIMGLLHADKLRITIDGTVLTERTPRNFWREHLWGRRMTLVFQHADEALNPRSTVAETFQGLPSKGKITRSHIQEVIKELFDDEPNDDFLNQKVNNLSGGQKQRLNLLRSLFLDTAIIILDEPLNGLDLESIARVLVMVQQKLDRGKGILLISHNEEIFDTVVTEDNVYYLHSTPLHG